MKTLDLSRYRVKYNEDNSLSFYNWIDGRVEVVLIDDEIQELMLFLVNRDK